MTNFEKYKDEIMKIIESSAYGQVAIKDGKPVLCEDAVCTNCELDDGSQLGNCVLKFMEWAYEDDDEWRDCGDCKHYDEGDAADPCKHCKRYYLDKFECRPKKRRQSEFLKVYPNANVLGIQPCTVEGKSFQCSDEYKSCSECIHAYWAQEVE